MLPRRAVIFLAFAWILVMLYPDPGMLLRSIRNTARPQIQPEAVAGLARRLPNDPRAIEAYVLDRQVPLLLRLAVGGRALVLPDDRRGAARRARRLREPGGGAREHPHRQGHPQRAAPQLRPHLGGLPRQAVQRAGERRRAVRGVAERALLHPLAQGLPAGTGDLRTSWRSTGRRRRRGACCSSSPASRSIMLWNAFARLLGAGRLAADGLLPDQTGPGRRRSDRGARARRRPRRAGTLAPPQRA